MKYITKRISINIAYKQPKVYKSSLTTTTVTSGHSLCCNLQEHL